MPVGKKGTLLIVSGPAHDPTRKHLHIVCTDPDANGNVVIVGVCSVTAAANHDTTCILLSHEHSFLRHDSYVYYREAKIEAVGTLDNGVAAGVIIQREDMNGQSFLKVFKGLCRSKFTPRKVKRQAGCPEPEATTADATT